MSTSTWKRCFIWLLTLAVAIGTFAGTAVGASTRYALVTDVTGTVYITKSGGTKEVRAFTGMGLNEGDTVKVDKGGSLKLKIADRSDEITLGENWNGVVSKLKDNEAGGKDTAVKTWSGSMYSNVQRLTGSSDTYKVETPTAVMGVRGTHLTVTIDPNTGLKKLFVNAGRVEVSPNMPSSSPAAPSGSGGPPQVVVLPAQMVTVYSGDGTSPPVVTVDGIDLNEFIGNASAQVIGALLSNKEAIDRENQETVGNQQVIPGYAEGSILDLSLEDALQKYRQNVENQLFQLLKSTFDSGVITKEELDTIIENANEVITDTARKYDLNREVPPIDPNAGLDPAAQAEREALRQEAIRKQQQQQQQKQQQRDQYASNNASLIQQIQQAQQELNQRNQQAQEQKAAQAKEQYQNSLTEQQRQALLDRINQAEQQRKQQEDRRNTATPLPPAPPQSPGGGASGGGGSGGGDSGGGDTPATPAPKMSVTKSDAIHGFELQLKLDDFIGTNRLFGVEIHFVHRPHIGVAERDSYYNASKFTNAEKVADNAARHEGTIDGEAMVETIYSLLMVPGETPISFDNNEVLATIPFERVGEYGAAEGTLRFASVQFVRQDGTVVKSLTPAELEALNIAYAFAETV